MKIISWNLWNSFKKIENPFLVSFLEPNRRRERRYLHQLKLMHEARADICFLQEVNPVFDKVRDFKEILNYNPTYQMDQGGVRFKRIGLPINFNNALVILTKIIQKKIKGVKLSGSFGGNEEDNSFQLTEFRYALFSEIEIDAKKILLVNTHFHHGIEWFADLEKHLSTEVSVEDASNIRASIEVSTARKKHEIDTLLGEIATLQSGYQAVIVAGDFNFSEGAELLNGFKQLGLQRVEHNGYTWDPEVNHENFTFSNALRPPVGPAVSEEALNVLRRYDSRKRTMDHIFVSSHVVVNSARIFGQVTNRDGFFPSDHFGLEVDLDF